MRGEAKNQTRFVPGGNLHCCYNRASLGVTKATGLKRVNIRLPASSQRRELVEGAPGVPPRRGRRHGFQIDGGTAELMRLLLNDDEFLRLRQSEGSDQGAPRCIRRTGVIIRQCRSAKGGLAAAGAHGLVFRSKVK